MSEVVIPKGISMDDILREKSSTIIKNELPIRKEAGKSTLFLGPMSKRAIWGINNPIHPIMPLILTAEAVISVATEITKRRSDLHVHLCF